MKLPDVMPQSTGKCKVCGKPTNLLIHQECGKKYDEMMEEKIPGMGNLTRKHNDAGIKKRTAKKYKAGKLPPWMFS